MIKAGIISKGLTVSELEATLKEERKVKKEQRKEARAQLSSSYSPREEVLEAVKNYSKASTKSLLKAVTLFDEEYMLSEHYRSVAIRLWNGNEKCACENCLPIAPELRIRPKGFSTIDQDELDSKFGNHLTIDQDELIKKRRDKYA